MKPFTFAHSKTQAFKMNILILGSGGREHALAWKIKQSLLCDRLFIAPGNAGTSKEGKNVAIDISDFSAVETFCVQQQINLVVVGPEEPLVNGIADYLGEQEVLKDLIVVGPSASGARLEGSKAFSKGFMERNGIPTASYKEFSKASFEEGKAYILEQALPLVLKADGLAAGKGVVIAQSTEEALQTFEAMLMKDQFGKAGSKVVIESYLEGIESSVFILTDGKSYRIIGHAKDYKRIGEKETGLNTGGMGCVSPVPFMDSVFMKKVEEKIIIPTINGLQKENISYRGFLFFGLMKVQDEPFVIEYNCRMGDPETEVVMPRLKNDLVQLFIAMQKGELDVVDVEFDSRACATVMAVSGGYPGNYEKRKKISLPLEQPDSDTIVFHAGTIDADDSVVTNGGRVLAVTSFGDSIREAVSYSLEYISKIHFEGMYYRRDIGFEFL